MAIVKMKRLRLLALTRDRDALLAALLHDGCVEVSEPSQALMEEAGFLKREPAALAQAKDAQGELTAAIKTLNRWAAQKKGGLFSPREEMSEGELLDQGALNAALTLARDLNERAKMVGALAARAARLEADRLALEPWQAYDVPLEIKGTKTVSILLGTVPSTVDFSAMAGAVEEAAGAVQVHLLSTGRQQHCLEILCHRSCEQAALDALRTYGFSFAQMKDLTGTVEENILRIREEMQNAQAQRQQVLEDIKALGARKRELQIALDRIAQVAATESAKERLLNAGAVLCLDGWVPAEKAGELEQTLKTFDCAWEMADPSPDEYDKVPVQLKNGRFSRCMNMVTEMYALPVYGTVDPNPLMAPFFILFYGIMMADMGYGILMVLGSIFMMKKMRPKGGMRNFAELLFYCGISTFVMGAVTGGFFGDFLTQLIGIISPGTEFALPALFTPMNDTIAILGGSLVLGFIQIITGQIVSFVEKARNGHLMDGIWDEGTWWVLYLAVGFLALGIGNVAGYPVLLIVGILMLAVGSTRNAKGLGKIGSFVGAVYNGVTGIFSDVMSYARLMALMLSGSIIASVFNTLGGITGNVLFFLVISMLGNALNFALNLLGCYVHDLRLQCLEFFGKFYQDGGKPFRPLAIHTKYVDVKEEN